MKSPALSIVVPVFNAAVDLPRFFESLKKQTYVNDGIELLFVDGGSTDATRDIVRKNGGSIINNPSKLAEPGVAIGFLRAKSSLVMVLAVDNIFKQHDAIEQIVRVFDDKDIVGAFPKHDTAPDDSIWSLYINTFTDPLTHFVYGDAANGRTFKKIYKTINHTDLYDLYDYSSNTTLPIIALAQGFTVRKGALPMREERFDDILIVHQMIRRGSRIAYIHGISLFHYTIPSFPIFFHKIQRAAHNALIRKNAGITKREKTLNFSQRVKYFLFIPYALSIIIPAIFSLFQALHDRNMVWLLHPIMVFITAIVIIWECLMAAGKALFRYGK